MATSAVSSFGTLMKIGDGNGGSEAFTTIAEVLDIKGLDLKTTIQTVTAHDTGPWVQKIPTLIDAGQYTFDVNFNALTTQGFAGGLYLDQVNRTKRNFQCVLPTTVNKTISFTAYVIGFTLAEPVDGVIKGSIVLEVTGQPTVA